MYTCLLYCTKTVPLYCLFKSGYYDDGGYYGRVVREMAPAIVERPTVVERPVIRGTNMRAQMTIF